MSDVITNFGRKEGTIQADAVTKSHLAGGFTKMALIAGGAAGDHTVTGIADGDELVAVWEQDGTSGLLTDRTDEFSISAADTINNDEGTPTTGDKLVVVYLDLT